MKRENINLKFYYQSAAILILSNILYVSLHISAYKYNLKILEFFGNLFKNTLFLYPSYYAMCASGNCQVDVLSLIILSPIIGFSTSYIWITIKKFDFFKVNNAAIIGSGIFRVQIAIIFTIVIINPFLKMTFIGLYDESSRFNEIDFLVQNICILNAVAISTALCMVSQKSRTSN